MNVMIYNKYKDLLMGLNIDVMKSLEGVYNVDEIIDTFTNFYYDKPRKLEDKKKELIQYLKELFEKEFIPYGFKNYGIMGKFQDIKLVFVNFDDENPTLIEAKDIKNIIEKSLSEDPLFIKSSESVSNDVPVIDYNDLSQKNVTLYRCTVKTIIYYGQNNNELNIIRIIINKDKGISCKKSDISSKGNFILGGITFAVGLISLAGLAFPPLEIPAVIASLANLGVTGGSLIRGSYKKIKYDDYEDKSSFLDESE